MFTEIFFKSISADGSKVSIDDSKRLLKELKMKDEASSAEEYVERTVG
jgi:hypothetical protein